MRRVWHLLLVAIALGLPAMAGAQRLNEPEIGDLLRADRDIPVLIETNASRPPAPLTLDLCWPGKVAIELSLSGGELVARYDQRLGDDAAARFAEAAGGRIARFDWAYDNLLIGAQPGMTLSAERLADGIRVKFTPAGAESIEAGGSADDDARSLELVRAQADAAAGFPGRARRRLARLARKHPDDDAIGQALAEVEIASDRASQALRRYWALAAQPGARIDPAALERAERAAGPRSEASVVIRDGKGFDQSEASLRGSAPIGRSMTLEGGLRAIRTRASEIVTASGVRRDVKETATVGEIGVAVVPAPGVRLRVAMAGLLDGDVVGASAVLVAGDPERQATLRAAYHLPDFATAEGAALGGWLDRIAAGLALRPASGLGLRMEAGLNFYGLAGEGVLARTATIEGNAEVLLRRQNPTIVLAYRLDAEYLRERAIRPSGFAYLPLGDRENHTGEIVLVRNLGEHVALTGQGGWTFDRFGGNGPTASLGARVLPGDGWDLSASAGVSSIARPGLQERQYFARTTVAKRFRSGS